MMNIKERGVYCIFILSSNGSKVTLPASTMHAFH